MRSKKEKDDFFAGFEDITPKSKKRPQAFEVGQTVKLIGSHPFAGHTGEVVSLEPVGLIKKTIRPRVRLHDMGDHEVFIMTDSDAKILT